MTALTKYARLEATGLWRATPGDQRREVIASIGDATLMITDSTDQALAHWSLAAVIRGNPDEHPAVFHPDGDPGETLELPLAEAEMIEAIETLRRAVEKTRPRPGRLRWVGVLASVSAVAAVAFFWVPGALIDHAITVVPDVKRAEIGAALLTRIERLSGPPCADSAGKRALIMLTRGLEAGTLTILPGGIATSLNLPGNHTLLNRTLVEDFEEPDVVAGYALAEAVLRNQSDPLRDLLSISGSWASFRLLTTGNLESDTLDSYAEYLLKTPRADPDSEMLLAAFQTVNLRSTPYAYARDVTGETVLNLIEGDPMTGKTPEPLLSDADWLRLQNICGG